MLKLIEIEKAVEHLPRREFSSFSACFEKLEAKRWDDEIGNDISMGLLDSLGNEALAEFERGKCKKL